ncbi:DUF4446 family protein [Butyrivibrio sp. NC3005]|uniref:DUF4446 family protein n=1 Tax=Butyrivibrio sp. NC3005 TaxID=1280685 RepID=UPI0004237B57|nr:DUF4446 family protein [Butyrivibrio sp. NC3005]
MNSNILNKIGLGSIDPGIYVIVLAVLCFVCIILSILVIAQGSEIQKLTNRINNFMRGREAQSLEDQITELFEDNRYIKKFTDDNKQAIADINERLTHCFQKVGVVKYDAIHMGGKLSCAIVLLDANNNGYVINYVHGNEGSYSYTKIIKDGSSDVDLVAEEKEAMDIALNSTLFN